MFGSGFYKEDCQSCERFIEESAALRIKLRALADKWLQESNAPGESEEVLNARAQCRQDLLGVANLSPATQPERDGRGNG